MKIFGFDSLDEGYYKSSVILCKDRSKKFTKEQLNDDFCDCLDGTDEPGQINISVIIGDFMVFFSFV